MQAISRSSVVVGYTPYIDSVADLTGGKELIVSGMKQERERCMAALRRAAEGATVALVSSGDPGVYGMAGLALELAQAHDFQCTIEIIPGVSAANAAAARLGAPLMLDYACISLSDLLIPWERIRQRIELLAQADMALALYNPRSTKRVRQLEEAVEILLRHRPAATPVGIVTAASAADETTTLTTLGNLLEQTITMRSLVIIGNSDTRELNGMLVTARGYRL
ncbi:precorrin-3 methyltransferase [Trichlorobacter thiogenes]|uniref:Precorrin-3 methyltransferase n=1 Tax=Trichlorobacter thiogenes TaxID=115783 RepID=A0A1T4K3U7_9BACT|nr:precorrin-3B C(17)-methyltransferase [Trichlorobacter thiogenes]SJZ37120.1 precorrin-3 methyltransferase [Trichlorobacter thiogenes]